MRYKRVRQGKPYTFQEFLFFSPQQFDVPVPVDEKDFTCKLKVCTNSGRCFTGPFANETVGEEELTKTEINKFLDMVNNTPGIIIVGMEYVRYDDLGGLEKYYG